MNLQLILKMVSTLILNNIIKMNIQMILKTVLKLILNSII